MMATTLRSSDKKVIMLSDKALIALDMVSAAYGVKKHDVLSDSRKEPLPEVRHVIWYLLSKKMTMSRIGFMFKKSTKGIWHGYNTVKDLACTYKKMAIWLEDMEAKLKEAWEEQLV